MPTIRSGVRAPCPGIRLFEEVHCAYLYPPRGRRQAGAWAGPTWSPWDPAPREGGIAVMPDEDPAGDRAAPQREFGVNGPMSCQELVKLARDYLKEALAPVERGAFLAGSGPEAGRLLTADRMA